MVKVLTEQREPLATEAIAEGRHAGLDSGQQFTPLPAQWRAERPDIADYFAKSYDAYKAAIVVPWVRALAACHGLIVLVDVVTILKAGPGMYNDNRQMLHDLLDVLRPGKNLGRLLWAVGSCVLPANWRPGGITRIAFVVPKTDLVRPCDRSKAEGLVRDMIEAKTRNFDRLEIDFKSCSAIVCAEHSPPEQSEAFVWSRARPDRKHSVPTIPDFWPTDWSGTDYVFPTRQDIMPAYFPKRMGATPEHINLDKVFDFLITGNVAL
jgi:predicted YcjX-like family ATPase